MPSMESPTFAFFPLLPAEIQLRIWQCRTANMLPDPSTFHGAVHIIVEHGGSSQAKAILPSIREFQHASRVARVAHLFDEGKMVAGRKAILEMLQTCRETRRLTWNIFILDMQSSGDAENTRRWPEGPKIYFPQGNGIRGFGEDRPSLQWLVDTETAHIGKRPCLLGIRDIVLWMNVYTQTSLRMCSRHARERWFEDPPLSRGIWSLPSLENVTILLRRAAMPTPQQLRHESKRPQVLHDKIVTRLKELNPEGRKTPAVSLEYREVK